MIGIPASEHWAYASHDGVNNGDTNGTWPSIGSSTCTSYTYTSTLHFGGYDWYATAKYPGNNFEGFFTVEDPASTIMAYTVAPAAGPFDNQTYYYLEVLHAATDKCIWKARWQQYQGSYSFGTDQEIPADHSMRWDLAPAP